MFGNNLAVEGKHFSFGMEYVCAVNILNLMPITANIHFDCINLEVIVFLFVENLAGSPIIISTVIEPITLFLLTSRTQTNDKNFDEIFLSTYFGGTYSEQKLPSIPSGVAR